MQTIQFQTETFSACGQISVEDIAEIAAMGFKTIINNRPDAEGGDAQPLSATLAEAAKAQGLSYLHIPVIPNQITQAQVDQLKDFLNTAPTPILGFCRTGNRASKLYQATQ